MDPEFWLERWRTQQLGFHLPEANPLLVAHWSSLGVPTDATVLVPLCGKSRDLQWLADRGHRVVGVELAEQAARAFFAEGGVAPHAGRGVSLPWLEAGRVRIFTGDFFALAREDVAACAAVYDRAALIALPPALRVRYAAHLRALLAGRAPTLLVTLEYDQERVAGPPFSVPAAEVERLFGAELRVEPLARHEGAAVPPKFAEAGPVAECIYALRPRESAAGDARGRI
ncbi:MAG: thiopurine S-methyltransferase [Myxococcales bacterium]|nr:thiopurine S-methyltransferase [Myxococcales bacterium]